MIKTFFSWLYWSSENSGKVSHTMQGILMAILPLVLLFTHAHGWNVSSDTVTQISNVTEQFVSTAGLAVSAFVASWGLLRKIFNTIITKPQV